MQRNDIREHGVGYVLPPLKLLLEFIFQLKISLTMLQYCVPARIINETDFQRLEIWPGEK